MKLFHQLDTGTKLSAAFALIMCLSTLLTVSLLMQLSSTQALSAVAGQKLSGGALKAVSLGAGGMAKGHWWVVLCIGGNLSLAAILALWLRAELARPLRQAAAAARRIADGDLRSKVGAGKGAMPGEAGVLIDSMQDVHDKLSGLIARLRSGTENLSYGAGQIAAARRHLPGRGEQHALTVEQAAAALHQLGILIDDRAGQTTELSQLVDTTHCAADGGARAVLGLAHSMAAMTASAKRIAGIVGVIDAIAFKASMLALDAAVEAARAGGAGSEGSCGAFALVAAEVRMLAEQSAAAGREIKALIDDCGAQGAAGSSLSDQATRAMNEVSASVQRASALVNGIAEANLLENSGVIQVSQAIAALDMAARQQALQADDTAAAAAQLRDQAGSLLRMVDAYLLGPEYAQPEPRIQLVASNPGKLSTPGRAVRASATVMPVRHSGQRGGATP